MILSPPSAVPPRDSLLDAVHQATKRLARVNDVDSVLRDVLGICIDAVGAEGGSIYLHEPGARLLRFLHVLPQTVGERLERLDIPDDFGVAGRVFQSGETEISLFPHAGDPASTRIKDRTGVTVRTMATVALRIEGMPSVGVVQLVNKKAGAFDDEDVAVLQTIANVCAFAVIHARLTEQRGRVAALEGMGRTAHDLANKAGVLATFLPDFERNLEGLRGVLRLQRIGGEAMYYLDALEGTYRDVFAPYSERVYRYARLVNDLAAGKPLTAKPRLQNLGAVVAEAVDFMKPQANRLRVDLTVELDPHAPETCFDELFVIRIVENLVGNALKAVRETTPAEWIAEHDQDDDARHGRVHVVCGFADGLHRITIRDTGPGLSPKQIRNILDGRARSSWSQSEGSGLGTKVVLELTQALGGRLSIESTLGQGAAFTLAIPQR